jgi:hypothetical protein
VAARGECSEITAKAARMKKEVEALEETAFRLRVRSVTWSVRRPVSELTRDPTLCKHGQGFYHGMTQPECTRYAMHRPPINTKPDFHLDRYLE